MKVKYKALIISISTMIFLITVTCLIFSISYFGYVNKQQDKDIIQNFKVLDYIIKKEEDNMKSTITDWSHWDDTYEFMKDRNEEYIKSSLDYTTLDTLNLKMMFFLNSDGNIIYSRDSGLEQYIIDELTKNLVLENKNLNDDRCGMLVIKDRTFIVALSKVIDSSEKAPSDGSIIFVREIDDNLESYVNNIAGLNIKFQDSEKDYGNWNKVLSGNIKVQSNDFKYLKAVRALRDINDEESIIVTITKSENENIKYYFMTFIIYFLFLSIIVSILYSKCINKYILSRLSKLDDFIANVTAKRDTSLRINISGNDEFTELAHSTNGMLSELNSAYEEILFLSYSDKLTGLKNRSYMEKKFDELDSNEDSKYFIIMGDLNGLKLANDAFGHKEGDKLIRIMGNILKENCEEDDIISRWGGDEFIILIQSKDKDYILNVINKIKKSCEKASDLHFKISIALGHAEKTQVFSNSDCVMTLAEKRMYRNKLMESHSPRNSAITSLLRTLHEKSSETEAHTMRIKMLGLKLGKKLCLTQDKLDELELLALLHDIGKIGVPEQILNKPSKLTDEEWEVMKKHTEIGSRIAESTQELAHISKAILAHHERYDGTGYPKGLKGDDIPLLSRIINVVDSFDVMTNKRVYKESSTFEYAVQELQRCSGSQFDPIIVDEFLSILKEK